MEVSSVLVLPFHRGRGGSEEPEGVRVPDIRAEELEAKEVDETALDRDMPGLGLTERRSGFAGDEERRENGFRFGIFEDGLGLLLATLDDRRPAELGESFRSAVFNE